MKSAEEYLELSTDLIHDFIVVQYLLKQRDKEWTDKIKEAIKEETYFRAQEALKKLLDNKDKND